MICVFAVLGYVSVQAAGRSVLVLVRELMEKNLKGQIEVIAARYTSLDNMGMAQDENTVLNAQQLIFDKLKKFKYKNTGVLYIIDDSGKILMQSAASLPTDISKENFFRDMKAARHGMVSYQVQGVEHTSVFDSFEKWKWIVAVEMNDSEIYAPVQALVWIFTGICSAALFIMGIIFFLGTFLGITRPINKIIEKLLSGAKATSDTSGQVSCLAQQLSQGSTEQAASLEQTSSYLDEMSSMTRQTADNADKANQLAFLSKKQAEKGFNSMNEMQTAMKQINESSQQVSKIIKTIEEIALQTNLLALNAAVEAARAGEHGKGFAVVANEVRSLALRASVAAKETATLIESNVQSIKNGVEIVDKSSGIFAEVSEGANRVAGIINNISTASKEQAEGVKQVTHTVNEIDQITQQTAASAKESVETFEKLSSQADELKLTALSLQQLISGEGETN